MNASSPALDGMTVNERLFALGLMEKWDRAERQGNRAAMLAMLEQAEVADPEAVLDATFR